MLGTRPLRNIFTMTVQNIIMNLYCTILILFTIILMITNKK